MALHRKQGPMNLAAWLLGPQEAEVSGCIEPLGAGRFIDDGRLVKLLGMSERQFRRYRGRDEEDGVEGLRRLGRRSPNRVPAADARLMLELYGGRTGVGM
jgi:hypothetical protein